MSILKANSMIKKTPAITLLILLILGSLLTPVGSVMAQENYVTPGGQEFAAPSQPQGPTDRTELEAFLDSLFAGQMEENHIAGAAVSVVKDGELFFAKGYGYADLEKGIPVDPEQTIFHVGSIGKTFTWTAVMQLAEQGKLDLDTDVNSYLDFRIPDTYPQPITLKHLMTHTSGFEERWAGMMVSDSNEIVPAREWLITHMAARVRPPGDCAAYSNYNAMLAGYIVSRVTGQAYDQYIQEHILDPLGMVQSSAQDPMPPDLGAHASLGYTYADDAFQAFPISIAQPASIPSGGIQASATDMARFMIAHLGNGLYSDQNIPEVRILKEATAQQMHNTQYTPALGFLGITYGFFDFSDNNQRTIGHRGYFPPMNSLMLLLPEQNLGVFVIYNSAGGGNVADPHGAFQKAFFDHYFPAAEVENLQPALEVSDPTSQLTGSYRQTSFPFSSFQKVSGLFGGMTAQIKDLGDGELLLKVSGLEFRFIEEEPLYFRQEGGPYSIAFQQDTQGRITRMVIDPVNFTAFDRLDWYETPGFQMVLLWVCMLGFLSMIPVAAIRLIRNRRSSRDQKSERRSPRVTDWIILGIGVMNLLVVVGTAWGAMGGMPNELLAPPLIIIIALGLGVLAALLTAGALIYAVLAWKKSYWGIVFRSYYTLMVVIAVTFVWFLNYWNLLGWRY